MRMHSNDLNAGVSHVSRATLVVTAVFAVSTGVLMPVATVQASPANSFMPALIATVTAFDVMSAYLLFGDFRDRGDRAPSSWPWPTCGR